MLRAEVPGSVLSGVDSVLRAAATTPRYAVCDTFGENDLRAAGHCIWERSSSEKTRRSQSRGNSQRSFKGQKANSLGNRR
jgi:hypothetical protein